ncbi:MAG: AAA family ATPase [Candidatus Cloacimonetes bacterium]|nr:AAA family ATPase [Candidatus Cloacimonadota bacterium]
MRLTAFRVQNYKKVHDTGWIDVGDLTAFVGKNEAGKSAVFRGLSKFNPSDKEKYDGLKEFPRKRYTDEYEKWAWPVSSCRFSLNESEVDKLTALSSLLSKVDHVEITRYYSTKYSTAFYPQPDVRYIKKKEILEFIDEIVDSVNNLTAPDGKGEELGDIKQNLSDSLNSIKQTVNNDNILEIVDQIQQKLLQRANEEWQKDVLQSIMEILTPYTERKKEIEDYKIALSHIEEMLPQFIYFDKYNVLDSAIHLPSFLNQPSPNKRITMCMFQHVGLDIKTLANLGIHNHGQRIDEEKTRRYIDERAIHFSSASNSMTRKFSDWWDQRKHKFRYQADGDYLRIWVSDDLDPSEIELDQRSYGMQYFFSFYLVFLVEAEGAHKDSILLLDEPGLHLHGTAQAKLIEFFKKLSASNQTMYSTHSPFLVDVNNFENVRAVYEDKDGTTKVTKDVLETDDDTIFPLQAAMGYSITQSLFIGPNCLIVEGPSDLIYLRCITSSLERSNRTGLSAKWTITPVGGADKVQTFVSLLGSQKDLKIAVLVDVKPEDRQSIENLYKKKLLTKSRVLTFGDYLNRPSADIEDMFDIDFYLSLVNGEFGTTIKQIDLKSKHPRVLKRIEDYLKQTPPKGITFNHYRPARYFQENIEDLEKTISDNTLDNFERIFTDLNKLLRKKKS